MTTLTIEADLRLAVPCTACEGRAVEEHPAWTAFYGEDGPLPLHAKDCPCIRCAPASANPGDVVGDPVGSKEWIEAQRAWFDQRGWLDEEGDLPPVERPCSVCGGHGSQPTDFGRDVIAFVQSTLLTPQFANVSTRLHDLEDRLERHREAGAH